MSKTESPTTKLWAYLKAPFYAVLYYLGRIVGWSFAKFMEGYNEEF